MWPRSFELLLNQARGAAGQRTPGFLELLLSANACIVDFFVRLNIAYRVSIYRPYYVFYLST